MPSVWKAESTVRPGEITINGQSFRASFELDIDLAPCKAGGDHVEAAVSFPRGEVTLEATIQFEDPLAYLRHLAAPIHAEIFGGPLDGLPVEFRP